MFGVLRGCSQHLDQTTHQAWWSHICGMCLTLGAQHGQSSRITTNYDAALLSVLYEAQRHETADTRAHVCPLRGFRSLGVVKADDVGSRYAAAVSLLMAATRIKDNIADGDGLVGKLPRVAGFVARRWDKQAEQTAHELGFDPELIRQQVIMQTEVEAQTGNDFALYAAPTEASAAAAFKHLATLANKPHNAEPLEQIGRMYGRMMLLFDSYKDFADDQKHGHFNALNGCDQKHLRKTAQTIFEQAMQTIRQQWALLDLPQAHLANTLMLGMLPTIGTNLLYPRNHRCASCATALPVVAATLPLMGGSGKNQPDNDDQAYTGPTRYLDPHQANPHYPHQQPNYDQYGNPQPPYHQPAYDPNNPNQQPPYNPQGGPYTLPPASYDPNYQPNSYQPKRGGCGMLSQIACCACCCDRQQRRQRHSGCCDGCCDCVYCCDDDCCEGISCCCNGVECCDGCGDCDCCGSCDCSCDC
ncbi:MAG: DUF3824 domain-containing protein [Herpetosiphon sp.]|nr:DUF3824 domain-containing protein [Herpetosiphon sp.]